MKPLFLWTLIGLIYYAYSQSPQTATVKIANNTYTGYQVLCDLSKDEIIAKVLTHYQQYKIRPFVHENMILAENIVYPSLETDKKTTIQYLILPDGNANAVQMVLWLNKVNITPQNYPEIAEKAKKTLSIIFEGHLLKQNTVFNTPTVESSTLEQRLNNIETTLKNIEAKLNLNNNPNQMPVTSFEDALKLKMRSEEISLKEKELLKREAELEDVDFALQAKQKALDEKEKKLNALSDSIQKQIKHLEKLAKQLNIPLQNDNSDSINLQPNNKAKVDTNKVQDKNTADTVQTNHLNKDTTNQVMSRGYVVPKKNNVNNSNKNTIIFKGTPVKYNPVPYTELTPSQIDTLKYLRQTYIQEQYLKISQKNLPCFMFQLDMKPQESIEIITAYMAGLNCKEYEQKDQHIKYVLNQGIPLLKIPQSVECIFHIVPADDENSTIRTYFEVNKQAITRKNNPNYAFEIERLILNIMGKL